MAESHVIFPSDDGSMTFTGPYWWRVSDWLINFKKKDIKNDTQKSEGTH